MAFLDSLTEGIGEIRKGVRKPLLDYQNQITRKNQEEDIALKNKMANEALLKVQKLEQQRQLAERVNLTLVPEGEATVVPEWGMPERLNLHQAYGQAKIDPVKMAEAQTARLAAQAFAEAIPNVKSDVGKINIGLGKEYKPNIYRKNKAEADDAELRLNVLKPLLEKNPELNPLLAADIAQNKSVFKPEAAAVQGENGKTNKAMVVPTISGGFEYSTVKDVAGQPMVIPTEGNKPTTDMRNTKYYADLWQTTEANAATILKSKSKDTPEEAWAKIVNAKSQNRFGNNVKPYDMLKNSMLVWSSARQGQALPVDVTETIKAYNLNETQSNELLSLAESINSSVKAPEPVVAAEVNKTPGLNQPFYKIPGLSSPAPQAPIAAAPKPQLAVAETQPLTPVAIQTAWTAVQKGEDPKKAQAALEQAGFDLSPEVVGVMAIDAVNSGVPANVLQQYLSAIGIEWQPEK